MLRKYMFEWYPTKEEKYGKPIVRTSSVTLSKPTGKTEFDAKMAMELFTNNFGNLHKNTIVKIKEIGEHGQIGEDITPAEDSAIIPSGR